MAPLEGIVGLLQGVVVAPQPVDLGLAVVVGVEERGERVLQLRVEAPAVLERRLDFSLHGCMKRNRSSNEIDVPEYFFRQVQASLLTVTLVKVTLRLQ